MVVVQKAGKKHAKFSFTVLSAFYFVLVIETEVILTLNHMLCFASISFRYMVGRVQKYRSAIHW